MDREIDEPAKDGFAAAMGFAIAVLAAQLSIAGWMFYEIWR